MEQKITNYEIILRLLREESHARAIAKILGANHMTLSRKMNQMVKNNILDFKYQGKNKVFFLKNTIEARANIVIAEEYKLTRTVATYPNLRRVIQKFQADNRLKLVVLFGSYSKGLAKKETDIDIYIETKDLKIKREYELFDTKLSIKVGEFNTENNLVKEIEKNHVIIKGVEQYYEKNGFFGKAS